MVIGAAFGAIVASLVADIIMPIVGAVTGGLDFSNYYLPLSSKVQAGLSYADAKKAGAVLGSGQFLAIALNATISSRWFFTSMAIVVRSGMSSKSMTAAGRSISSDCKTCAAR